jgi:hypothetical protein
MKVTVQEGKENIELEIEPECGKTTKNFKSAKCCGTCKHIRTFKTEDIEFDRMSNLECYKCDCVVVGYGVCDYWEK